MSTPDGTGPLSPVDCGVCATPLIYASLPETLICTLCGGAHETLIWCPNGHFVCDACHGRSAREVLAEVVSADPPPDPGDLLERAMAHPAISMHGPEHHAIVPAVVVAAACSAVSNTANGEIGMPSAAGPTTPLSIAEDAVRRSADRGSKVPGGWCGYYGTCGAAVGVGIAVSVITQATPLKGRERSLALAATSAALERMHDGAPRCCKRASRTAVAVAVGFLREQLGVELAEPMHVQCVYSRRNAQCPRERCPYFGAG
jgi:hypothetical protein